MVGQRCIDVGIVAAPQFDCGGSMAASLRIRGVFVLAMRWLHGGSAIAPSRVNDGSTTTQQLLCSCLWRLRCSSAIAPRWYCVGFEASPWQLRVSFVANTWRFVALSPRLRGGPTIARLGLHVGIIVTPRCLCCDFLVAPVKLCGFIGAQWLFSNGPWRYL